MSHFPGTARYTAPNYAFDKWLIQETAAGRYDDLLALTPVNLDEVGESELLTWCVLLGITGGELPGNLLSYQELSHHGHAVIQFAPGLDPAAQPEQEQEQEQLPRSRRGHTFTQDDYVYYRFPEPRSLPLNRFLRQIITQTDFPHRVRSGPGRRHRRQRPRRRRARGPGRGRLRPPGRTRRAPAARALRLAGREEPARRGALLTDMSSKSSSPVPKRAHQGRLVRERQSTCRDDVYCSYVWYQTPSRSERFPQPVAVQAEFAVEEGGAGPARLLVLPGPGLLGRCGRARAAHHDNALSSSARITSPGRITSPAMTIGTLTLPPVAFTVPCAETAADHAGKPISRSSAVSRMPQFVTMPRTPRCLSAVANSSPNIPSVDGEVVVTTRMSPSPHCSTAAWIIRLSPGQDSTVTAVPAMRVPCWLACR